MSTAEIRVAEVAQHVTSGLLRRFAEQTRGGSSIDEIGTPKQIADQMLAALPGTSPWSRWLGPVYTTGQLVRRLGVTRQALDERRRRGTILALKTADGHWIYPAIQFDDQGLAVDGLSTILGCFRDTRIDAWSLAGWLVSPQPTLDGRSVLQALRQDGPTEAIEDLAREAAFRFSR